MWKHILTPFHAWQTLIHQEQQLHMLHPLYPPSPTAASPPAALTCPGCTPYARRRSAPGPPRSAPPQQASRPAVRPARGGRTAWRWPGWPSPGIDGLPDCCARPILCATEPSFWYASVSRSWAAGRSLNWWWASGPLRWSPLWLFHSDWV